ncbi:MAG TPA: hypothetical protein VE984_02855 [Gaiellaceae bacterium]|nr:hypothetical protein [Gaiellaceae bacterium]
MYERETKPIWTSATFLVYTGGLTVLLGGLAALAYLSASYGSGAQAGWALLVLVVLYAIAHALRGRERPIAAGIFAFAAVLAWAVFLVLLFEWWGWNGVHGSFKHWSWSRLALWLLILLAARDDRRRFGFPFIRLVSAVVGWIFVVDLVTAGGSFTAAVTLIVGLAYLVAGWIQRTPSSFWLHLVGGVLIGGSVLYWLHTSDGDWAVVSIVAFLFVLLAYATKRSSWAVLGTVGFYLATIHYLVGSPTALVEGAFGLSGSGSCVARPGGPPLCTSSASHVSPWSPALAFGLLGFFLVALGMLGRRRTAATLVPPAEPPPV